ncbi:unnamed protein product [Coregonus sp. 'balchen']|nr:unnamed protein product [Coregonus sp. 'balchen']
MPLSSFSSVQMMSGLVVVVCGSTSESLTNQNEEELQRRCEARQQEILETKVQLLQEEVQLARGRAEKMASLAEEESQRCLVLERERMMMRKMEEDEEECEGGSLGARLQQEALAEKERVIEELTEERRLLSHRVGELEVRVHDLSSSLQKKDRDAELLRGEMSQEKSCVQQEMQVCGAEILPSYPMSVVVRI